MNIVLTLLGMAAIILVGLGVRTVPQGYEYTVQRFGRFTRVLQPGLNLIIPIVDTIGNRINRMEQTFDIPSQQIITSDNATAAVNGIMYAVVIDTAKAAYGVANLERALSQLAMTNIRSVLGEYNLDDALSKRDEINGKLLKVLDEAAEPWGTKITRVEIQEIEPSADLLQALGSQMKAEREKRSEILLAEGKKQAAILEAEGRLEAANKDAEARERLAQAEAKATKEVSEAIANGDPRALNYFIAQKYTEALQTIGSAENHKVVMLPLEASNLMGSISGIQELLKGNTTEKAV
jgi:regulator of protease activity HflC (stomatin/prohibitin superfamily)